jgi:hypothetical protein
MQFFTNKGTIVPSQRINLHGNTMPTQNPAISFLIFAGSAIKDVYTGKWSYINVFDEIVIPSNLEFFYQSFCIGGRINHVSAGDSTTEIQLLDPNGNIFASQELTGTLVTGDVGFAANFDLVKFEILGKYKVNLIFNGHVLPTSNKTYIAVSKHHE